MAHAFKVVTYNVLANSYIRPERYPETDMGVLRWETRRIALGERIKSFGADVVCLQEVEEDAYTLFEARLAEKGYHGAYAQKAAGRPDGCATFFNRDRLGLKRTETLYYQDGEEPADSGHLALILSFECDIGVVGVVNTHLKWDREGQRREDHTGYRQIRQLLDHRSKLDQTIRSWIVCGDFNAESDSAVVTTLLANGFEDAYRGREQPTCNSNRRAKRIDYIFHTANLTSRPSRLHEIGDLTPLPSEAEPSDHLALMATFV